MTSKSNGFTLLEVMTVVFILGVLAAVAVPRFVNLTHKAQEAEVKASLGTIRSAVRVYYADNEGRYPDSLMGGLMPGEKYLSRLPLVTIPANDTNPGHRKVTGEKLLANADDDVGTGVWMYNDMEGETYVNCLHFDNKGSVWSSY